MALIGCKTPQSFTNTVTETKWRDTTIYVKIPVYIDKIIEVPLPVHDTLKIIEKVYVDKNGQAEMKPVTKKKGIIGADISITNGKLFANLYLTDSTLLHKYKDTLNYEDSLKIYNAIRETDTNTNTQVVPPPEKYIPKIYKYALWIVILQLILLIAYIVIKWKLGSANALKMLLMNKFNKTG